MSSLARDDRRDWQANAACQGEMGLAFYPPPRVERKAAKLSRESHAKRICATCPVRAACLQHALDVDERFGIWGGLSESERKHLHS